jgi:hypothetical protein
VADTVSAPHKVHVLILGTHEYVISHEQKERKKRKERKKERKRKHFSDVIKDGDGELISSFLGELNVITRILISERERKENREGDGDVRGGGWSDAVWESLSIASLQSP